MKMSQKEINIDRNQNTLLQLTHAHWDQCSPNVMDILSTPPTLNQIVHLRIANYPSDETPWFSQKTVNLVRIGYKVKVPALAWAGTRHL